MIERGRGKLLRLIKDPVFVFQRKSMMHGTNYLLKKAVVIQQKVIIHRRHLFVVSFTNDLNSV